MGGSNMLRKFIFLYRPFLQHCLNRRIFTSVTYASRIRNHLNPYTSVLKDDMFNLTPGEVKDEISFMSNMPLQEIVERQNHAEMDIKLLMKRRRFKNIERKYFKNQPEPSFLTYSMKEQIRNLHMLDSNLWTPVNLSYVFPASLPELKKLIKDRPPNLSEEKLKLHDEKVLENWKKYAKGQFGSIALLKKNIEKRFSEVNETRLPAASMGSNKKVNQFLDSLKFTEEDDEIAFHDEKSRNHLKKLFKCNYPFRGTFKELITNYNDEVAKLKVTDGDIAKVSSSITKNEITECQNLDEILPDVKKDSSEIYIKVNAMNKDTKVKICSSNPILDNAIDEGAFVAKNVTYDEFFKLKTDPKVKSEAVLNLLKKEEFEEALTLTKELLSIKANISHVALNLLLQHLSKSGDYANIELIGNQLCDEMRRKTEILIKLGCAYQTMGKTEVFLNRVLNHYLARSVITFVTFIPSSFISNILVEESHLESLVKKCALEAAKCGYLGMMAGLLNAYLILSKFKEADEIYSKHFENASQFYILGVCNWSFHNNNYSSLNAILELANRHPAGREKIKAIIYSTLIDLLCKENKFEEAVNVIENLPSHGLQFDHLRKCTTEKLKLKMEKNGMTFPFVMNNENFI